MVYPNSTPEFRIYKKLNGDVLLQVRYINITQKYTSAWQDILVVEESLPIETTNITI
jgi:hypothetical protein